ncbi:MAG: hypothetical protein Q9179_004148 [Wetmoreana sp. 5 TL-2023]
MRFGKTLESSIYEPWRSKYIDYPKLKRLLREDEPANDSGSAKPDEKSSSWTEEDEGAFVDELVNVQLEKVNAFHDETYKNLRDRTSDCESKLHKIAALEDDETRKLGEVASGGDQTLQEMLRELDSITEEINELEKYSRINFTGFLKAAKKHDRRRGFRYRVRPLLQVRLAALPFNSEDYSPLLSHDCTESRSDDLQSQKARRKPYGTGPTNSSRAVDGERQDPRITSLYFDNPGFSLYNDKVCKISGASSLRLRWFGHLNDKTEIFLEKKTTSESGDSDEIPFSIKEKYIQDFITGRYKMEKPLNKLRERHGHDSDALKWLQSSVDAIQAFIQENKLQPMLRANYTRTAFQIPGDDRVRISLDTDVAFIREDSLDQERPCRDPSDWHRHDIDANNMDYPFPGIRRGEISRFPYALLEIKVRDGVKKKTNEWVRDLMASHLVKEAPRFSKFVHGIAQLFEDHVNSFPFWLSDLETDIRRDPETAFQEEQEKKAKQAAEEQAVGSLIGSQTGQAFTVAVGSPIAKSLEARNSTQVGGKRDQTAGESDTDEEGDVARSTGATRSQGFQSFLPSFPTSRYGPSRQKISMRLPPGVREPGRLIKDTGPVRVEPKVWLANQRTFVKWQHISVLLATLSLSLYNAAGEDNSVARSLAIAYTLIAALVAVSYLSAPR